MSATYMPATPPPSGVVAALNPEAAKAIDAYNAFDESLPARRSAEQLKKLDELRAEAFEHLGDDLFVNLAAEKGELVATLTRELAALQADWRRLEELAALNRQAPQRPPELLRPAIRMPRRHPGHGACKSRSAAASCSRRCATCSRRWVADHAVQR